MEIKMSNVFNIINNMKPKTALLSKVPIDMRQFSSYYNNTKLEQEMPPPGVHKWLNSSEKLRSKKEYEDFSYTINDIGFRDEYPEAKKSVLGFFGCSFTFGEGLPSEKNFPRLLSNDLNMPMLNLGMPGTGAHRIYLTMVAASNIWNIDTAIVTLPNFSRFHYVDNNGNFTSIVPPHPIQPQEVEKVRRSIVKTFSENYLMSQTRDAVQNIIILAKLKGIKLILGSWDMSNCLMIKECFKYESINYKYNLRLETARDNIHPGPQAALQYMNEIKKFIEKNQYV